MNDPYVIIKQESKDNVACVRLFYYVKPSKRCHIHIQKVCLAMQAYVGTLKQPLIILLSCNPASAPLQCRVTIFFTAFAGRIETIT